MLYFTCFLAAACGYLVGGINPSIILSKLIYKKDIRECGSGNLGFTNFKRTFGNGAATWVVLIADILKTALPIIVFSCVMGVVFGQRQLGAALTGFACMLGHAFPVWYGFRGGKSFIAGFATACFVDWRVGLIFLGIFMLLLFTAKYMSLASIVGTLVYPIALPFFHPSVAVEVLAVCSALLVILRHRKNIARLFSGKEPKFHLKK